MVKNKRIEPWMSEAFLIWIRYLGYRIVTKGFCTEFIPTYTSKNLPRGFVLTDAIVSVVTGFTGAASLGFKYKDGEDSTEVPQNDKYFFDAKDVSTAGVIRADKQTMVKLPKDAQLIMTFAAANTKKSELRAAIMGELVGAP